MSRRSDSKSYINVEAQNNDGERPPTPWYWRLIALVASWMILGGYLILPGLYMKNPELKFSQSILSVFVVALLTAGYSFTALLCFACRDEIFQAEAIFLPALASSALGLLTIAYNFLSSRAYEWGTAAITGTVISTASTVLYGILLLWTHRRIVQLQLSASSSGTHPKSLYSEPSYYSNFLKNMYPSAMTRSSTADASDPALSEDDRINQQMARLLKKHDAGPSPDAASATFRIDLPEDREEQTRQANSQELLGSPPLAHAEYNRHQRRTLSEDEAWERWDRGRTVQRPISDSGSIHSSYSRNISREARRREIELGQTLPRPM